MVNIYFFIEDKAHQKFLIDFIAERFGISLNTNSFYKLEGWSGYKKGGVAFPDYEQKSQDGFEIITTLDADDNTINRRTEVLTDFTRLGIKSHLFLFPNDERSGEIETALIEIAVDRKLMDCFEGYEKCIADYQKPVNKSKVFAYLDALLKPNQKKNNSKDFIQEDKRNYRNNDHWNLKHEYLNPLFQFLQPFFQ